MTSLERSSCKELILSLGCVPFSRVICSLGIWLRLPELMGFPVLLRVSLIAQSVKNLAAIWGPGFNPWVGMIPLEEGMATHSSILAWRIPMDRGAWRAVVHGVTVRHD